MSDPTLPADGDRSRTPIALPPVVPAVFRPRTHRLLRMAIVFIAFAIAFLVVVLIATGG